MIILQLLNKKMTRMNLYTRKIYQKKTKTLLSRICITWLFLLLISENNNLNAQKPDKSVLLPGTIEIDSITIKAKIPPADPVARPYTEPVSLLPVISKISYSDISKQGAVTLIDAMNYIPGGFTETRGRQVKQFFSVRGQKYPYPAYAINGVWQKEFEELPYFFSASDIEEIEIIRSSAALLTGLSGLAGLINIKTREYTSFETTVDLEYGTFNSLHSHVSTGNKIGRIDYAAGIGFVRTSGPSRRHAKEAMADLYTRFNWQISDKLGLNANLFYLDGERQMAIALPPADQRYLDMKQGFDPYKALLSNLKLTYRPNSTLSSELQIFYSQRNPTFIDEVAETTSNEKDYEYGVNFIQSVRIFPSNVIRFGGLYNHWIAPNGKRFYTGKRCDTETISAVITDEQKLGPFTLDAGLRITGTYLNEYAAFNIEGEGGKFRTVTPVTDEWEPAMIQGSFGISYNITESFSAYINSAAGHVKPREGSLNEDLDETSNESRFKIDAGMMQNFGNSGKLTLTVFGVFQKDAIALSGLTYLDPETNIRRELYLNRNQNQQGFEFEILSPVLFGIVKPFVNLTLMQSKMEQDEEIVINKENPVWISSGGLYAGWKNFDLNILGKYVSPFENERFVNPADGPQPLGDFFVLDLNGGYSTKGKVPVKLYLRVKNMTDKKYSTVNGWPDFGRMIFGGIQVKFGKEADKE
jgi:outer membrane receptor protein involved in Fe transport